MSWVRYAMRTSHHERSIHRLSTTEVATAVIHPVTMHGRVVLYMTGREWAGACVCACVCVRVCVCLCEGKRTEAGVKV